MGCVFVNDFMIIRYFVIVVIFPISGKANYFNLQIPLNDTAHSLASLKQYGLL